jgi:hypothetical protein
MDLLQDQVAILTLKVDSLYQVIEHLSSQTTEVLTELKSQVGVTAELPTISTVGRYASQRSSFDEEMEHKDVLVDVRFPEMEPQSGERQLTPEVQVQRLTAQLTAAYNRIAALEEQLLSKRMTAHS